MHPQEEEAKMKTKLLLIVILLSICLPASNVFAKEISLFDSDGEAVAYIDTSDDFTIYLWKGKPVAYLDNTSV